MNRFTMGIIDASTEFDHEEVGSICAPLLPFAGNFRLIDFMLSNFSNARIKKVCLALPERCHSLVTYIGGGEDWQFGKGVAEINYLPSITSAKEEWLQVLLQNAGRDALVVLTKGTTVCNIELEFHRREHILGKREITILTQGNIPIGTYILSLDLLLKMIDVSSEKDNLITIVAEQLQKLSCVYVEINGYGKDISSIEDFYQANMEIIWPERMRSLLFQDRIVYRKQADYHPTLYGPHSKVSNALIGQGCRIDGTIENSIVFPNCKIAKDVRIRNCIVMEDSIILSGEFGQMIYSPSVVTVHNVPKNVCPDDKEEMIQ